jgi:hypothetical protein
MQAALVTRCLMDPAAKLIYAIPNGGGRSKIEAAILKGEGVRRGMLDLHLPIRRGHCTGLYLELKAGRNGPSEDQDKWAGWLSAEGHHIAFVWDSWELAWSVVEQYTMGKLEPGITVHKPAKKGKA